MSEKFQNKKESSLLKKAAMQAAAGGSAGFVEVSIMQPLDVIKTRLQLQNINAAKSERYYKGIFDCMVKMSRTEGVLSFWKGILPPILAETPKRALKFLCFEQFTPIFMFGSPVPTPLTYCLAGFGAGITEAIAVNPFEVVKVAQQAERSRMKEASSTYTVTKRIINQGGFGFNGINKGLTATMSRNGVYNMAYFGFYHSVKNHFQPFENETSEFLRKVAIGFTSGVLGSVMNIPFDVVKSRIQGPQPEPGKIKYKNTISTISIIYKEEGFLALYKGLLPKVMRLGPGGAIMLLIYEYSYKYLQERFE